MKLKSLKDGIVNGKVEFKAGQVYDIPTEKNSHVRWIKRGAVEVKPQEVKEEVKPQEVKEEVKPQEVKEEVKPVSKKKVSKKKASKKKVVKKVEDK